MTRDDFIALLQSEFEKIVQINRIKGHDYAGEDDALSNFKRNADRLGLTSIQVWAVYFHKHLDAIETFVREGGVASEPIEGRIQDAILYLFLLRGLIEDGR
jgi:cyclopropane fatty-acyl-phospholipid synthase-like methyltransferase